MRLYVDPQSPYAYLALSRAERVLGALPEVRVILLGALFARRGHGSWAFMETRPEHEAAIAARAEACGLPPVTFPAGWPAQSLAPARAATWALREGRGVEFLHAFWRQVFAHGAEPAEPDTLAAAAADAGLDPGALAAGIAAQEVKDALRAETEAAWEAGVRGIPTLALDDGRLLFGDDQLEAAVTR